MGDQGVTLDFSKAQPINPTRQQGQGVTLDFSKAQPIHPPAAAPAAPPQPYQAAVANAEDQPYDPEAAFANITAAPGAGVAKSAAESVVRPTSYVAEKAGVITPEQRRAALSAVKPQGTAEHVGAMAEETAEWFALEGLVKGGLKLIKAGKWLEGSQLVNRAARVAEQAVIGGTSSSIHGGDASTGAAIGAGVGVLGEAASAVAGVAGNKASELLERPVPGEVENTLRSTASKTMKTATGGVPSTWKPPLGTPSSIRRTYEEAADHVMAKAKSIFKTVDEATGNRLTPVQDQLRALEQAKRGAWEEGQIAKLEEQRTALEATQEKLFQEAQSKGVPRQVLDQARATYRQSSALSDVDHAVKMSTSGMRPELNGTAEKFTPETIDPKKLFDRLNKLYDSGRLQDAFGGNVQHMKDVMHVLDLARQPKTSPLIKAVIAELGKHGLTVIGGGYLGYAKGGVVGSVAGAAAGAALPIGFEKLMASPGFMRLISKGLDAGASASSIAAAAINAANIEGGR